MKKTLVILLVTVLAFSLLLGCGGQPAAPEGEVQFDQTKPAEEASVPVAVEVTEAPATEEPVVTEEPTAEPVGPSPVEELYAQMEATGVLTDMAPYSQTDLLDLFGIDPAVCECAAGYVNASGLCDQVVLAVAVDETNADAIYNLLSAHVERLLAQYNGYDATAYATVQKAELFRNGNAVVLIISPEAASLVEICRNFTF